ncbi:MAG TPA: sulfur transferase domain-containing protein, partial [Gemmatimonadales bacterium]|nr:sulfur transferase domain-containing protein [Gemmatimonadales bacterium]
TTVVNLRTPEEMTRNVSFDEAVLVRSLGMTYVHIPMRGNAEYPYSPAAVTKFAEAMRSTNGKVLLHCTVAWRASHLWGAYLIRERGVSIDSALANARAINLSDERPPIEQLLDQSLPAFGRPPRSP